MAMTGEIERDATIAPAPNALYASADDVGLRRIRAHGWTRDLPQDTLLCERGEDAFSEAYRFILPAYNVRPMELSAAIGQEQIKKLPAMTAARRANWEYFKQKFADDNRFLTQREHGKASTFSFTMIPESTRRVIRFRFRSQHIHAPTAALIYQFREVLAGRHTRVPKAIARAMIGPPNAKTSTVPTRGR